MLAQKNPYIESAYERLQIISQDKEKQLEYEAREKAILDHNQMILEAEEEGEARGKKIGEAHGKKIGEVHGKKLGEARVNKLITFLIEDGRLDDLKRSAKDSDYQERLMKEYDIV